MAVITKIIKRNGSIQQFDANKITEAIWKAFKATGEGAREECFNLCEQVLQLLEEKRIETPTVEQIQDLVEKTLMKNNYFETAKAYIIYREKRAELRKKRKEKIARESLKGKLIIKKRNGKTENFNIKKLENSFKRAAKGFEREIDLKLLVKDTIKNIYNEINTSDLEKTMILSAVSFIERDPAYNFLAARLFLQKIYKEVMQKSVKQTNFLKYYRKAFIEGIHLGVEKKLLDKKMKKFDLKKLSLALKPERDLLFKYIGIQTLYERYFLKTKEKIIETPQSFWMRVAMGLAIQEKQKTEKAIEFYNTMSELRFIPSTPTLFHSGTTHPQLSSCYITTVQDDLKHIFKCLSDNAQLSKWSGGLGNDWTNIRATGAWINSTKVESQGVIPFLKIANDVTMAINRSGKRRGATCAYLENWHLDIEDFLDLRRNTGDERRRTHDMNTAIWVPDLFMKRVINNEKWTLFSPDEVPDLHESYGKKFEEKYKKYEELTEKGKIRKFRVVNAVDLWKKMITRLFETGHPWITFKDPCNIRSPQSHVGVIHSSNLCTEITLNTSADETAVCNLGSINLEKHVDKKGLQKEKLAKTINTAMRMLDNVIDINFYPTIEAANSNKKHRPVGLGLMGLQDAFFKLDINFESNKAIEFCDKLMEFISYNAIKASCNLAKERGKYSSFNGSKWSKGIFPLDTIELLEKERGIPIEVNRETRLDWESLKKQVKKYGLRNSNTMAIAPTATISNISGCFPCTEPIYKNIYVKSNISGEFTIINHYLVQDLKKLKIWNKKTLEMLKYYDGNPSFIPIIPQKLKEKYKETFEIDPEWTLKLAAVRAKWIDQSQSNNIFFKGTSGKKISETYISAWRKGIKTTYYLRTLAASQIEKATLEAKYGLTQKRSYDDNPVFQETGICEACE